jgi:hypothetical protein
LLAPSSFFVLRLSVVRWHIDGEYLSVAERVLLFYVTGDMEWERAGVTPGDRHGDDPVGCAGKGLTLTQRWAALH